MTRILDDVKLGMIQRDRYREAIECALTHLSPTSPSVKDATEILRRALEPILVDDEAYKRGEDQTTSTRIVTERERDRYREALEDIIANEEAYKRGDGLSAHIARSVLGTEPEWSER